MIKIFNCYNRPDLLTKLEVEVFEFLQKQRKTKTGKIQKPEIISLFPSVSDGYYILTIYYKITNIN